MWLTARTFLQKHATVCEYLVFHEFRRNLYIALAKYIKQEGIADLIFQLLHTLSFQTLKQSHETKVAGYCTIVQTCFSLPLV